MLPAIHTFTNTSIWAVTLAGLWLQMFNFPVTSYQHNNYYSSLPHSSRRNPAVNSQVDSSAPTLTAQLNGTLGVNVELERTNTKLIPLI